MRSPIRDATPEDAAAVSALVHASFREYIAADWEPEAGDKLILDTAAEKMALLIAGAVVALVHEDEGQVFGAILLPRPNLVQLCFVAPGRTGRGIGRSLWEEARARLEELFPEVRTVELNASPYAVPAYKAFGFHPISEPFVREGAVATRMACWLPARALAKVRSGGRPSPSREGGLSADGRSVKVRRLISTDAAQFQAVRLRGLCESPSAFASSHAEEVDAPLAVVAERLAYRPEGAIFGAFSADALRGVVGIQREGMTKLAHKAFIWGMYVVPEARMSGVGRALIEHALAFARSELGVRQVNLGVNTQNTAALALYRRVGFEVYGTEREFLLIDGVLHDEHHMVWRAPSLPLTCPSEPAPGP